MTATPGGPPLLVLGVRRSGTTLLRVMLDRHSELAVPDESYFVPQLADRHLRHVDPDDFVDDLRRIDTLADWDVPLDKVRARLTKGMPIGAAIATVYAVYADERGKSRWGDKTPMYMQNLRLLERLFPDALFVHLIRDGRDAALSFLSMPKGLMTETWMQPRDVGAFASQWRAEVKAAQRLGRRVEPTATSRCATKSSSGTSSRYFGALLRSRSCHTSRQWRITQATSTSRQNLISRASGSRRRLGCATGACRCPRRTSVRSTALRAISWTSSAMSRTSGRVPRGGSGVRPTARVQRPGGRPASGCGVRRYGVVVTRPCADFFAACRCLACRSARICGLRRACHAITIPFSVKK